MSYSLWPHGLHNTRLSCPLLSPWVCWNSCRLNQWCHPTISSSVIPFSLCHQSFPASGSFPISHLFASGDRSVGASASVFSMDIQVWCSLDWLVPCLGNHIDRGALWATVQGVAKRDLTDSNSWATEHLQLLCGNSARRTEILNARYKRANIGVTLASGEKSEMSVNLKG